LNVLIISSACIVGVNRTPYKILSSLDNINLTLLIPYRKSEVNTHNGISDIENCGFPIILSEIIGIHPRLEKINNLKKVVDTVKPDVILLEFDVATIMMYETIKFSKKYNSKITFIALENFNRNFLVETFRAAIQLKLRKTIGAFLTYLLYKYNKNKIDLVFCVSDDGLEAMKYLGFNTNKIVKIPLGIDTELFYPFNYEKVKELRKKQNLNKITIAYFGRIIPEKGLDNLIYSLNNIRDIEWELLVDNFNSYKSEYLNTLKDTIIKYRLQERIRYFDAIHSEMPNFINCADIVVLPSKTNSKFKEQYGRVVAEALCCGKIVLVSNSGALPELIGDVGFIFEKENIKELSEKLKYLIENHEQVKKDLFPKIIDRGTNLLSAKTQANIIYKNL
jgi:glycosyltransferase involved in cell wall biosynthesis